MNEAFARGEVRIHRTNLSFIRSIPHERVVQFHLAGHTNYVTHLIDTHDHHVIDPVWELYRLAHQLTGGVSTLLEWDANIPPFQVVHDEVLKAKQSRLVPCLHLLRHRFPVNEYYSSVRQADSGKDVAFPGPDDSFLAITRRDYVVRRVPLSLPQYELLASLQRGEPVGAAIAAAASAFDLDDACLALQLRQWFRFWAEHQFFMAIE